MKCLIKYVRIRKIQKMEGTMLIYIMALTAETNSLNIETGISDNLIGVLISTIITGIITIIGFAVTYFSMRRNFKNELQKQHKEVIVEKLSDSSDKFVKAIRICSNALSDNTLSVDDNGKVNIDPNLFDQFDAAVAELILYGTDDMINVMYYASKKGSSILPLKHRLVLVISAFLLVFAMIRHEFTGVLTNPDNYFMIVISSYEEYFDLFKEYTNEIVTELKLNEGYMIS